jgi:hypothetical protein
MSNATSTDPAFPTTPELSTPSLRNPRIKITLGEMQDTNANATGPQSKKQRFVSLTPEQFEKILDTCSAQQTIIENLTSRYPSDAVASSSRPPSYYANAKYEEISCKPLKPIYDGSEEHLISFLTRLDIRRQNEGWAPATYIQINSSTIDLTCHFSQVTESQAKQDAERRWTSPNVNVEKHALGHETYHSRLLAIVLMSSITESLSTVLLYRIPQLLRNDGTYILWTICNNVHRNNVAFKETVREKITTATLSNFNNDITNYLIYIKDNLKMISSATNRNNDNNGLITYIFRQLKLSNITLFQDYIRKYHVEYQEAKHPNLTIDTLLEEIENKIRVLKHAGEWLASDTNEMPAMALSTIPKMTPQLEEFIQKQVQAQLKTILNRQRQPRTHENTLGKGIQDWMLTPPTNPAEIKRWNNKEHKWCQKCRNGQGQWACAHDTSTHIDNYRYDRRNRNPKAPRTGILKDSTKEGATQNGYQPKPRPSVSFASHDIEDGGPFSPDLHAQLSLAEGIDDCFLPEQSEE